MEVTGTLKGITEDIATGELLATLAINEKALMIQEYTKLKSFQKLKITMVKHCKKRSLDANNYAWKLMSEIAEVLRTSKEAVYELMLIRYGTNATDADGNLITISVPAKVDIRNADIHCAFMGKGFVGDKEFNHYRLIKGSSMYDTKEMSRFIDGVVGEAKDLEIDTVTPQELKQIKERWGV